MIQIIGLLRWHSLSFQAFDIFDLSAMQVWDTPGIRKATTQHLGSNPSYFSRSITTEQISTLHTVKSRTVACLS